MDHGGANLPRLHDWLAHFREETKRVIDVTNMKGKADYEISLEFERRHNDEFADLKSIYNKLSSPKLDDT